MRGLIFIPRRTCPTQCGSAGSKCHGALLSWGPECPSVVVLCPHLAYKESRGSPGELKPSKGMRLLRGDSVVEPGGELSIAGSVLMPAYAVWSRGGSRPNDLVPASLGASVSLASCNCLIPTPGKGAASSFSPRWWLQGQVEETTLSHPSLLPKDLQTGWRGCWQGLGLPFLL